MINTKSELLDNLSKSFKKNADNIAVVYRERGLTYRELDVITARMANHLIESGIDHRKPIAYNCSEGLTSYISIVSILRSGYQFLPIDNSLPEDRKQYIHNNSGATELTHPPNYEITGSVNSSLKPINSAYAYTMYTSGSTGVPKGIQVGKHALSEFLRGFQTVCKFTDQSVVIANTSFAFDISIVETLMPLYSGAKVVLLSPYERNNPTQIGEIASQMSATVFQSTPSLMKLIIQSGKTAWLRSLEIILVGGEAFEDHLASELKNIANARIVNCYGPTEATVWVSTSEVGEERPINIGTPFGANKLHIVNEKYEVLPSYEIGDLLISGPQLAEGYIERDSSSTLNNAFQTSYAHLAARVYITGDKGYVDEQDRIHITGRSDDQVKINGHRIELGEIVSRIMKSPEVKDVVCFPIEHEGTLATKSICAVLKTDSDINLDGVVKNLTSSMPSYMLPSIMIQRRDIPLNINGKADIPRIRSEIEMKSRSRTSNVDDDRKNQNLESLVASVFMKYLYESIPPDELMYKKVDDLGINSFQMISILMDIEEEMGLSFAQKIQLDKIHSMKDLIDIIEVNSSPLHA